MEGKGGYGDGDKPALNPVVAGTDCFKHWIPACAGMTGGWGNRKDIKRLPECVYTPSSFQRRPACIRTGESAQVVV